MVKLAALALVGLLLPAAARAADPPEVARLHGRLGAVTEMRRWTAPRADGGETDVQFLVRKDPGLPQAVQVLDAQGEPQALADVEGADCTLAAVTLSPGPRGGAVVWAVRPFTRLGESLAEPAAMDVYVFRPQPGNLPGDSAVVLRASGPPARTAPLCRRVDILRAMAAVRSR